MVSKISSLIFVNQMSLSSIWYNHLWGGNAEKEASLVGYQRACLSPNSVGAFIRLPCFALSSEARSNFQAVVNKNRNNDLVNIHFVEYCEDEWSLVLSKLADIAVVCIFLNSHRARGTLQTHWCLHRPVVWLCIYGWRTYFLGNYSGQMITHLANGGNR